MFEKVNPAHPDKIADRIGGALVDLAYCKKNKVNEFSKIGIDVVHPKVALEIMVGHGECVIVGESEINFTFEEIKTIVERISKQPLDIHINITEQDKYLADNQSKGIRCGDNGIFRGMPITYEEEMMTGLARIIYSLYPYDGKYMITNNEGIICQSHSDEKGTIKLFQNYQMRVNPLGYWVGGIDVDTGCSNRKLGSDMGRSVTGGGIHCKDCSKADVTMNICAFLEAQEYDKEIEYACAIGDKNINGIPYVDYVEKAFVYITALGGFEKFAEWGLIR